MKEVKIKAYRLGELAAPAKQRVLERYYHVNLYDDWEEPVIEAWKKRLSNIGFSDIEISWSGFCSQGDGASFTASYTPKLRWQWLEDYVSYTVSRKRYSPYCHYVHENTIYWECEVDPYVGERTSEYLTSVNLPDVQKLSKEIYRDLEKRYYYLTSEEQIEEALTDDWFTVDGKLIHSTP